MRYAAFAVLLLVLVGAAGVGVFHYRRAAEVAALREVAARAELETALAAVQVTGDRLARAREEVARLTEELECVAVAADEAGEDRAAHGRQVVALRESLAAAQLRVRSLEADLHGEIAQRKDVDEFLEKTAQALRDERERHNKEIWEARQFMPEGLRLALRTVNELLRLDGRGGMQFLRARKIEDDVLHRVQMIDRDAMTLGSTIYIADEVTFDLDRIQGALTLTFLGGYSRGPYGREEFPPDGKRLLLKDVNGRAWEDRLPFLVTAHGQYPLEAAETRAPALERSRRLAWQRRINALLEAAQTDLRFRVDTFRGLAAGSFTECLFLGYDDKKRLAMSVEAKELWVQVNDAARTVEVWMKNGTIRRKGGEVAIPSSGYRIQLTGLQPKRALDAMLGMVKRQ